MLRVNGLFGWIRDNDRRSIVLFLGFLAALHLLALPTLFIPLIVVDPAHAPITNWGGYVVRYVVPVTLLAAGIFGVMTWWSLAQVKRRLAVTYVWKAVEPRLCRIAEPLLIAAGVPEPQLAVIESPALNAFAYGLGAQSATLVVTRGLIDGLDEDELGAVLAHEITHIRNGDVRFMAAANAFLSCIRLLDRANTAAVVTKEKAAGRSAMSVYGLWTAIIVPLALCVLTVQRRPRDRAAIRDASVDVRDALAWMLMFVFVPFVVLPLIALQFLRQQALNLGELVRFMIASSREFIADAGAVELTKNPAALVSALRRVEGRSALGDLPRDCQAMMIDGDSIGEAATHPGIAERIAAIVRTTGSMALIAPSRRDTRPSEARGFGRRGTTITEADYEPRPPISLLRQWLRIATRDSKSLLGLGTPHLLGMALGVGAMIGLNQDALAQPMKIIRRLDPSPSSGLVMAIRINMLCSVGIGETMEPGFCSPRGIERALSAHAKDDNLVGTLARTATAEKEAMAKSGMYELPGGGFSNVPPDAVQAKRVAQDRCFDSIQVPYMEDKVYTLDDAPSETKIDGYLGSASAVTADVRLSEGEDRRAHLLTYLDQRMIATTMAYAFWGKAGWDHATSVFANADHTATLAALKAEIDNPAFLKRLTATQHADAVLLLEDPRHFRPCIMTESIKHGLDR